MNTISVTAAYDFSNEQLELIAKAFTDSNVIPGVESIYVYHIANQFRSYGHWKLSVSIEVDGKRLELSHITTDSMMIDDWSNDGDFNLDTLVSAFDSVITANEYEIADALMEEEETE